MMTHASPLPLPGYELMQVPLCCVQVKGYPTLKVIHKGEEYKAYKGPRELSALKTFITDASTELTQEL